MELFKEEASLSDTVTAYRVPLKSFKTLSMLREMIKEAGGDTDLSVKAELKRC